MRTKDILELIDIPYQPTDWKALVEARVQALLLLEPYSDKQWQLAKRLARFADSGDDPEFENS